MKSMLETAFYLLLMTMICYVGLDFVRMNQKISKANEVQQYIRDYIEVHGIHQPDDTLDAPTCMAARNKAEENDMSFNYEYTSKTARYAYYQFRLEYNLPAALFRTGKTQVLRGFARSALSESGVNP